MFHMGENQGEIIISTKESSYQPPKLALFLLFVAICGFFWGSEIDSDNDDSGIDCDNPDTYVGYEGLGCDAASAIQICCVIIPLFLSIVLLLLTVPHNEEEE
jgi:hypothetical protein